MINFLVIQMSAQSVCFPSFYHQINFSPWNSINCFALSLKNYEVELMITETKYFNYSIEAYYSLFLEKFA